MMVRLEAQGAGKQEEGYCLRTLLPLLDVVVTRQQSTTEITFISCSVCINNEGGTFSLFIFLGAYA